MVGYKEIEMQQLKELPTVVYGCGRFGLKCINILHKHNIHEFAVADKNSAKMNPLFQGHTVIPLERFKAELSEKTVILAIEDFGEPLQILQEWGGRNLLLFYDNRIFAIEDRAVLGEYSGEKLTEKLLDGNVYLCSENEKIVKDFAYIFDWLNVRNVQSMNADEILKFKDENSYLILAEPYSVSKDKSMKELGFDKGHYAFLEEVLLLLNYRNMIIGKIPSIMAEKTIWGKGYNQYLCKQPFEKLQLSSDFSVHCCCGDWGEAWGNLQHNTMQEIWNSDIAKIFRCSILNRTYSFCNLRNCVHMKIEADETEERIEPAYTVDTIPRSIEVGIDKTCNLFCKSCRNAVCVESGEKKRKNEIIAQQILDSGWLDKTEAVLLGGQGEVFVSDIYKRLMCETDVHRKVLDLRTNGTLFTRKKLDELLQKYEWLRVIVSIDAACKETYDVLRRSNNPHSWDNLKQNLKMLSNARKAGEVSFFQINMCVQMLNYKEIPAFVEMGEELDADMIYLTPIRNWGTYTEEEFLDISIFLQGKQLKKEVCELARKYRNNPKVKFAF